MSSAGEQSESLGRKEELAAGPWRVVAGLDARTGSLKHEHVPATCSRFRLGA